LTELTKKDQAFEWTNQRNEDFENLRKELASPNLVLQFPDFEKMFYLNTNASKSAPGAVLSQEDTEGNRRPIAYAS